MDEIDQLYLSLSRFHLTLSNIIKVLEEESKKQKAFMSKLLHVQSSMLETLIQKQDSVPSLPFEDTSQDVIFPELEESDKLLNRCKILKKKFLFSESNSTEVPVSAALQSQNKTCRDGPGRRKMSNTNCKETRTRSGRKINHKTTTSGVIKQTEYDYLTSLLKEENDHHVVSLIPSASEQCENGKSKSPGSTHLHLLEKNKTLKALAMSCLDKERCRSSVEFLHTIETSICQCCLHITKIESVPEGCASDCKEKKNFKRLYYSDVQDVMSICRLLSDIQYAHFHCLVHRSVQDIISPITNERKQRLIPGLHDLVERLSSNRKLND